MTSAPIIAAPAIPPIPLPAIVPIEVDDPELPELDGLCCAVAVVTVIDLVGVA